MSKGASWGPRSERVGSGIINRRYSELCTFSFQQTLTSQVESIHVPPETGHKTKNHFARKACFCLRPENRGSVLAFFSSPVRSATEWTATQHVGWWGGVGCNDILELAHMVDATVNLLTWLMLRNMMGWGGRGMMLTFLELAYMVDATQHDGVGWVGNDVNT